MRRRVLILIVCLVISGMLLQGFPNNLEATSYPTSSGMTEFALKALRTGWGYVYGTYGHTVTNTLVDGKKNQYPAAFAEIMSDGRPAYDHSLEWIGHRAADCAGLMKAYLWWQDDTLGPKYVLSQDQSANTIYNSASIKGPISTIPNTHGVLVWRSGHIGVYIGNGEVIEARGVEYGVVKTRLSDRNWTNWCRYPFLSYPSTGWIAIDNQQYYYRNGAYVTGLQTIDGKTWLFGQDGARVLGFHTIDGQLRYLTGDGSQMTGWQTIDGARYFFNASGTVQTGWQTIDGKRYLFNSQGVMLNGWQQVNDALYYLDGGSPVTGPFTVGEYALDFDVDGKLATGWQQTASGWTLRDLAGRSLTGLQMVGDQIFFLNAEGIRQAGWQTIGSQQFYFDPVKGTQLAGGLQTVESKPVILLANGARASDRQLVWSGSSVYLSNASGQPLSGQQVVPAHLEAQETPINVSLLFHADTARLVLANQTAYSLSGPASPLVVSKIPSTIQTSVSGAIPTPFKWLSMNPDVATVDQSGLVTTTGAGHTLIILSGPENGYAAFPVTVLPDPSILTLTQQTITAEPGMTANLPVKNLPADLVLNYRITSSKPDAVTVLSDGRQVVKQLASSEISLWQGDTKLLTWTVRGQRPLVGISIARTDLQLPVGGRFEKLASLVPVSGTGQTMLFSSANPAVGTVDASGNVKALAAGSTVLTAKSGSFTVTCALTVSGQYPLLKRGSAGEPVRQLQKMLAERGYLTGSIDGAYGPMTEFAVTALQRKMNVSLTGQAEHSLQVALQDGLAPAATPVKTAGSLTSGDQGEQVFSMQTRLFELNFLKSKPGGNFGPLTLHAVKTMQVLNGLPETGIASNAELALLFSSNVVAGQAVLSLGDTGYEVLILQQRLTALNYYAGPLDGIYSASVETAVRTFQKNSGLTVDGEAGFITQSKIFASTAPPNSEGAAPAPTPIPPPPAVVTPPAPVNPAPPPPPATPAPAPAELKLNSQGDAVIALEARLVNLGYHLELANSSYDSLTASSVKSFQQRASIGMTGIADLSTQQRLAASTAPRSAVSYRYGSTGDGVKRIQLRLIALGHLGGTADGKFGPMTLTAAKNFQRSVGLTIDGIMGSRSLAKLFYSQASAGMNIGAGTTAPPAPTTVTPPSTTTPTTTPTTLTAPRLTTTLRIGSRGDAVRQVQLRLISLGYLKGSADGIFGSMTDAAVRSFQRRAGLSVDGIIGSRTINRLFDGSAPRSG